MEVKLTTLSPVHIGTEERLTAYVDYIYDDGYLYYIDYDKLGKRIASLPDSQEVMDNFVKVVRKQSDSKSRAQYDLQKFIEKNFKTEDDLYRNKVPAYTEVTEEVSAQIKSSGRPFIPGSSVKGALRTAILAYHIREEGYNLKNQSRGGYIGEDIFGEFNKDVMKNLQVSDTDKLASDMLEIATSRRYHLEEFSHQMTVQKEAIRKGAELKFSVHGKAYDISERFSYLKPGKETEILKMANQFSLEFLKEELEIVSNITDLREIESKYKSLLNQAKEYQDKGEGALLRLGSGKSFYNNVILNYYNKEDREKILRKIKDDEKVELFPKTRSVIIKNGKISDVLGWIKMEKV